MSHRLAFPQRRLWGALMALLVGMGMVFRVTHLDQPVYWVDEVATSMRVSGYTQAEVREQVATGQAMSPSDLLKFQVIRRDRPLTDVMRVLMQSPEHAPLYFILARFWAQMWGSSIGVMRSLPVIFSLLALPAMYGWGRALFSADSLRINPPEGAQSRAAPRGAPAAQQAKLTAQSAMGLLAISPFFIAYAQEARPYSLWILLLLLTSQSLRRSLQTNRWTGWISYTLCLTLTLYTSLLTVLVVCGQGLAALVWHPQRRRPYGLATGAAFVAFLPWISVVLTHWQTLQSNTRWMQIPSPLWATLGTWFYSLAVLFFDVPVATNPFLFGLQVVIAAATLSLLAYAVWVFVCQAPRSVWGGVLMGACAIPACLLLLDGVRNGQSAATPRYLMPTHLGALIALAYLFGDRLLSRSRQLWGRWQAIAALLLLVSLVSCLITQPSPYLKSRNLSNAELTILLNQADSPQVITTPHYIQDTISLSYGLEPDVRFYILPREETSPAAVLTERVMAERPVYLFAPSETMQAAITDQQLGTLTQIFQPPPLISGSFALTLWQVTLPLARGR